MEQLKEPSNAADIRRRAKEAGLEVFGEYIIRRWQELNSVRPGSGESSEKEKIDHGA